MLRRLQMKQEKIQAYLLRVNRLSGVVYKGYLAEVDNTLEAEQRYDGCCSCGSNRICKETQNSLIEYQF